MEDKEEIVITLVHGTFAQNAEWTLGDSPFCESLKRSLPGPLTLLPFQWSGKNSERARQVAVRDLRQRLRLSILEHPSSRHFVIGHSHGGNISVQAVMGTDLERQVAGITCLAVPFLFMSPRLQTYEIRNFKALRSDEVTFYLFAIMGLCMLGASLGICAAFILNIDPAKVSIAPPTTLLAGQAHTRKGASIFDVDLLSAAPSFHILGPSACADCVGIHASFRHRLGFVGDMARYCRRSNPSRSSDLSCDYSACAREVQF